MVWNKLAAKFTLGKKAIGPTEMYFDHLNGIYL